MNEFNLPKIIICLPHMKGSWLTGADSSKREFTSIKVVMIPNSLVVVVVLLLLHHIINQTVKGTHLNHV